MLRGVRAVELKRRWALVHRGLLLVSRSAGRWTAAWAVLLILQGLIPAGIVFGTKWIVDAVAEAVNAGANWEVLRHIVAPGAFMGGLLLMQRVMGSVLQWIQAAQSELVLDEIKERIHEKASLVDYAFYETSSYYDRLEQANSQAGTHTLGLLRNVGTLVEGTVTFVSIALILMRYSVWLPFILFISTVPALIVVVTYNRKYHAWWKNRTTDQRWAQYFDTLLTKQIPASEVRALGLGTYFRNQYKDLRARLRSERLALLRSQAGATIVAAVIALVSTAAVMAWMVWRALGGSATLGDLALFYQAFNQGQNIVRGLLSSVGQIYTNTLFLEHLFGFLEQPTGIETQETGQRVPKRLTTGITFQDVTFSYPGGDRPVLTRFNLHIPADSVVAIVGENGAGKSTLTKLLLRLYDPTDGQVLIDGVDIRDVSIDSLREHISMMFQIPMRYQATAAENIAYGDLAGMDDIERIEAASRAAGADEFIDDLPRGLKALLGRMFEGGTELSGGEWQRVALARAFLRQAPIIVLDEPTNFMDSWAEIEWLRRFRLLAHGKTSIIITHRFTTAMQADVIYVMRKGHIIESGSHEELLHLDGIYAKSWRSQTASRKTPDKLQKLKALGA